VKSRNISNFLFICLAVVSISVFAMEQNKQEEFVFNRDNYFKFHRTEGYRMLSKNGEIFFGILVSKEDDVPAKVHVVNLPEQALHFSFDLDDRVRWLQDFNCSLCGRYVGISFDSYNNVPTRIWDVHKKECVLIEESDKRVLKFFFGRESKFVALAMESGNTYYCNILIFDLRKKQYVEEYKDCLSYMGGLYGFYMDEQDYKQKDFARLDYSARFLIFIKKSENWKKESQKFDVILFDMDKLKEYDKLSNFELLDNSGDLKCGERFYYQHYRGKKSREELKKMDEEDRDDYLSRFSNHRKGYLLKGWVNKTIRIETRSRRLRFWQYLNDTFILPSSLQQNALAKNNAFKDVRIVCQDEEEDSFDVQEREKLRNILQQDIECLQSQLKIELKFVLRLDSSHTTAAGDKIEKLKKEIALKKEELENLGLNN